MPLLAPVLSLVATLSTQSSQPVVLVGTIEGAINPATAEYITMLLRTGKEQGAEAVILRLNTPGGLLESTRSIVQELLQSPIPVVVYIAPSGARAGSAGVFITLAAHVAVMAPGTNIGAAHPVGLGGESPDSVMANKITNDAAAFARSIAQQRKRNVRWAEDAVRRSISSTEREALREKVIDLIAPSLDSLLKVLDGRSVELPSGVRKLRTAEARIEEVQMNWRQRLLALLSNPDIAYILLMLGIYGLLFELYNPGAIVPGVVGAICLILGAYALQMLPVNYAGLALIAVSIVLFLLELKITSYGLLTLAGLISLLLGSIMLIDSPLEFMRISWSVILPTVIGSVVFFGWILGKGIQAQLRRPYSGGEGLIGLTAVVVERIMPDTRGRVRLMGELWWATAPQLIEPGTQVRIVRREGFVLHVEPIDAAQQLQSVTPDSS
ncbi:MAG: nodulation protein NfeD [Candidatus Kapabacteria bacterium]|nr:nodulation protein NfeD [Candidatus Kapabacteria bacterium]MDW8012718.1 nodulation protein NfeD [Bacteroidota bacterium]